MTEYTHDQLIELAEGPEGPGSETWRLTRETANLLIPEKKILVLNPSLAGHEREAAMVLMEEALPGWSWEMTYVEIAEKPYMAVLANRGHSTISVFCKDSLARALLIATLKAHKAQKEVSS